MRGDGRAADTEGDPMDLMTARRAEAFDKIYQPRRAPNRIQGQDHPALYDFAAKTIGDAPIQYLEFGVFEGRSMQRMLERFRHPRATFAGFDSFRGLPEDWVLPWSTMEKGTFSTGGRLPNVDDPRVTFVRGWIQDTLPGYIGRLDGRPVLVNFDADLYSVTLFVLATLWPVVPEYYFIFDEFIEHECLALHDFATAFPVDFQFLCATDGGDGTPNQVFGRIRRTTLALQLGEAG
jgi:hypothetical protein